MFKSQLLFDSCIKNRSMVITEDFLPFKLFALGIFLFVDLQCPLISGHFAGSGQKRNNDCYFTMSDGIFPHS